MYLRVCVPPGASKQSVGRYLVCPIGHESVCLASGYMPFLGGVVVLPLVGTT